MTPKSKSENAATVGRVGRRGRPTKDGADRPLRIATDRKLNAGDDDGADDSFGKLKASVWSVNPIDVTRRVMWLTKSSDGQFGCSLCIQRRHAKKEAGGPWAKCAVKHIHNRGQVVQHGKQECHMKSIHFHFFGSDDGPNDTRVRKKITAVGLGNGAPSVEEFLFANTHAVKATSSHSVRALLDTRSYASAKTIGIDKYRVHRKLCWTMAEVLREKKVRFVECKQYCDLWRWQSTL